MKNNTVSWSTAMDILGNPDWHEREAVLIIGRDVYCVESSEMVRDVIGAPWSWEPSGVATQEESERMLNADSYEWQGADN